ncbi:hypothetical protein OH687_14960 [Burkholderia anthina]|nr:hypothetical protein OH687_14960 [Burkholderia anthina]
MQLTDVGAAARDPRHRYRNPHMPAASMGRRPSARAGVQ